MNFSIRIEVHLRSIRGSREREFLPQLRVVVAPAVVVAVVVVVEFLLRRVVQCQAVVQQERGCCCCCCCFKEFSEPRLLETSVGCGTELKFQRVSVSFLTDRALPLLEPEELF